MKQPRSVLILKAVRKWRDRLFMFEQRSLDLLQIRGRKRILFHPWIDLQEPVTRSFLLTRHEIHFGPIPPGGGDYDLVVPLSVDTLKAAAADPALATRNPLPLPTAAAVGTCDDKAVFVERMRALGFNRNIPADVPPGRYPYILKKRCDSAARNIYRIENPADEEKARGVVNSPDYLRQECVLGDLEYSAHLLVIGGEIRRAITMNFRMPGDRAIKGRDHVIIHRRCHPNHLGLFRDMLNAIGFEGLCCVNYKLRDGVPVVFEINPRMGFSLGPFFSSFVRSLDWKRAVTRRTT